MAYLSLYRKYRSQSFEEVSGQDHVIRTLQNAIRADRVAHAYLFCGPRGTGKTSTARLLAKALNCDNGPTPEPCGICEACVQIAEGRFMDIKEIDAASNRGIDDIRDLRDKVAYPPTHGRRNVYVIDEAHQITGDAFNALLKTLEEPPPYVVFILATTESHKIPATIVSRCQRFEFRRASLEDLRSRVAFVAEQEGATLDDAALELIAKEANGGWRDALSVLEQVLSFCDGKITSREVYAVLGTVEADSLHSLAECILSANGAEAFRLLEELVSEGKDPRQLLRDLTQHFRGLMLAAAGVTVTRDGAQAARIAQQSKAFGQARIINAVEVLAQTDREARWSEQPGLLLELVVARLMHPRVAAPGLAVAPQPAATQRSEPARPAPPGRPERPAPTSRPAPSPAPRSSSPFTDEAPPAAPTTERAPTTGGGFGGAPLLPPPLTLGDARTGRDDEDEEDMGSMFGGPLTTDSLPEPPPLEPAPVSPAPRRSPSAPTPAPASTPGVSPNPAGGSAVGDIEVVRRKWRLINEELKRQRKVHVQAAMSDTEPDRFEQDTLVIRFPYQTNCDIFAKRLPEFGAAVSQAIESVVGIKCRIRPEVEGKGGGGPRAAPASPSVPSPRPTARSQPEPSRATERPQVEQRAERPTAPAPSAGSRPPAANHASNPHLTHDILEIFDGRIVDGGQE